MNSTSINFYTRNATEMQYKCYTQSIKANGKQIIVTLRYLLQDAGRALTDHLFSLYLKYTV